MFSRKNPSIPEYFSGKNIFLTGGTGFLGKVLIEKLLRSCPNVGDIYVLVRQKRGSTLKERREDIINAKLFDIVKEQNPKALDKVKCIAGDTTELKLGISDEDERLITSKVNIIYHGAASVRFDDPLRSAVITNIRSTREIVELASKCAKLEVFMHISTAYCNVDSTYIEEEMYPSPVHWKDAIDLAESDMDLSVMTVKYTDPWPNTYTFTKRIAEHVTADLCKDKIPAVIFRPSIIVHADSEPMPGWVDNMNGPFALAVAGLMGVACIFYAKKDSYLDFISVDNVVKGMLGATWETGLRKDKSKISIYNACSELKYMMPWFALFQYKVGTKIFLEKTLWKFTVQIAQCWYWYYIRTMLHVALSIAIDGILKLQGRKPRLLKLVRLIYVVQHALTYFMTHAFVFNTDNFDGLDKKYLECDKEAFRQVGRPKYMEEHFRKFSYNALLGVKRFVFKEREMTTEEAIAMNGRYLLAKHVLNYTLLAIFTYFVVVTWIL